MLGRVSQKVRRNYELRGKKEVVIFVIDTSQELGKAQYRDLRKLAVKFGLWIPYKSWHNSEYEWVFLEHIPDHMIVGTISFE